MTTEEYIERMWDRPYLTAGSDAHECMHRAADEARRITAELNGRYHTDAEICELFCRLTGRTAGEGFRLRVPRARTLRRRPRTHADGTAEVHGLPGV